MIFFTELDQIQLYWLFQQQQLNILTNSICQVIFICSILILWDWMLDSQDEFHTLETVFSHSIVLFFPIALLNWTGRAIVFSQYYLHIVGLEYYEIA